jgi:chloramphenicol-sensitive protein RarD
MTAPTHQARLGVAYGLAAYLFWGFVPIYFKSVAHVPPGEVLAHRIIWSLVLMLAILSWQGRLVALRQTLRNRHNLGGLLLSSLLVALNWFTFIWAVEHNQVMQASLGYFINPLVNVLLGFLFLRERLRPAQRVSVFLAATGVLFLTVQLGQLPLIALILAFSFGFYGLIRKKVPAEAGTGLTIETLLLSPAALVYLTFLRGEGNLVFGQQSLSRDLLLVASGPVTALPLLWFAKAARRLRYATVGFLQYLAPTFQFLLAVVAYGEDFTRTHLIAFSCIWTALLIFSLDSWRDARRQPERE